MYDIVVQATSGTVLKLPTGNCSPCSQVAGCSSCASSWGLVMFAVVEFSSILFDSRIRSAISAFSDFWTDSFPVFSELLISELFLNWDPVSSRPSGHSHWTTSRCDGCDVAIGKAGLVGLPGDYPVTTPALQVKRFRRSFLCRHWLAFDSQVEPSWATETEKIRKIPTGEERVQYDALRLHYDAFVFLPTTRSSKIQQDEQKSTTRFATVCNVWTCLNISQVTRQFFWPAGSPWLLDCPLAVFGNTEKVNNKKHVKSTCKRQCYGGKEASNLARFLSRCVLESMPIQQRLRRLRDSERFFFSLARERCGKMSVDSRLTPPLLCRSRSGSIQRGRLWQCHHVWLFHARHSRLHGDVYHDSDEESSIYTTSCIQKSTQAVKSEFQTSRSDWKKSRE